jgi:hypothetical protein
MADYSKIIEYIKSLYPAMDSGSSSWAGISGNEKKYLLECIDTRYVSYVGACNRYEKN